MLKVMIVDDEFYFREALKVSLPWKELGFDICGEAKNGKDASEKVEELNPDIIIVDINMPIMDGLEFVQSSREKGINSKIIILTGHSEFNYARQAVQLGVHDYILKPVNEEELTQSLLEMKKIIEMETSIKIEFDMLKQQVSDSLPLLKEKFLNDLIQGNFIRNDDDLVKKMEYLNINIRSTFYQAITIEIDYEENLDWNNEDRQLWKFAVSNVACEILSGYLSFDICYDKDDRICIITGIGESGGEHESELLEHKLESIREAVCKHFIFSVTIGAGNVKNELFDIAASYKESIVALKNKLTLGKNKVITYGSVSDLVINTNLFTAEYRNKLLMNMRTGDDNEVGRLISQTFTDIRRQNVRHEILSVFCIEMVSTCLEIMAETGLGFKDVLPVNQLNIIEQIQLKRSINEIEAWIHEIFMNTSEAVKRNRNSKTSRLIEKVKKYIEENYHNSELGIDEIARHLYINYAYLCSVFKRDTGITINEYLTEFRINRAKKLFDAGNAMVLDVADRVGYADANYFGKCFKKYYGLAPSKYIESISHR
ncbi:MAG TPA: response regulator [Clostridia bacterium]|nr:response regulator [Clostridia bacterium]